MKLLFICPNLNSGGAERHWSVLLPLLAEKGCEVSLITLDGEGPFFGELVAKGIPCVSLADCRGYPSRMTRIANARPDIVVTQAPSADAIGFLLSRARDLKWVVNWHRPPELNWVPRRRIITASTLRFADVTIAVTPTQMPELSRLGVSGASTRIIPNGTDVALQIDKRATIRERLNIRDDQIAIVLAGRLERQKRVDIFIDAIRIASTANQRIIGLIAGSGSLQATLQRYAADTDIRFLGRTDRIQDVFCAADLFCLTSDAEALPYVVIEAMACGLPIVATDTGELANIISPAVGTLVPIGDPVAIARDLVRLAQDPALRRSMGTQATVLQRATFSAQAMADAYFAEFTALLEK